MANWCGEKIKLMPVSRMLTPEILVPRLGEYLVARKIINQKDLEEALTHQKENSSKGKPMLFGDALLNLGFIRRDQLDQAITEQIIQFRTALEDANRNLEARVDQRTAELQEVLRKLSELNQLKSNFVSNISHELRTPLTHIKGYLEMLAMDSLGPLSSGQIEAIRICLKASANLESLINNLILFSLSARGELTLKLGPVEISKLVKEIISLMKSKADDKGVNLDISIHPDLVAVEVKADEEKISWALLQLLDNAIKFTKTGGKVVVSISSETNEMIMISVKDTGIGIPSERQKDIFEAFHQLDGSSTRYYGGTGLGLALVKDILDAHGSLIEVKSVEGKGTTIQFPLLTYKSQG